MSWINLIDLVRANPPTQKEIEQVLEYRRKNAKARFYVDENFPSRATEVLRSMGGRVITVQDSGRRGHPDSSVKTSGILRPAIALRIDFHPLVEELWRRQDSFKAGERLANLLSGTGAEVGGPRHQPLYHARNGGR